MPRCSSQQGLTNALVRDGDGERLGIFTTTDLRDALLRDVPPAALAVREVARFELIEVHPDAELFEALWLMVRHRVHRLLVRDGDAVLGVLSQLDLVSFVANHSHIVALQIDEADSVAELQAAALRIDGMVALLHDGGIKIERIARLVGELNQRLFARLWSLRRAARAGRQQLPARDGQRGPRRADPEDRPGQRAAAARRLRLRRARGGGAALQRRAGRVRLPAVPGRHHAHQPAAGGSRWRRFARPCATGSTAPTRRA